MMLVVCFVGGMLYYSMNVLWPRQSGLLFVPAGKPIIAGVYANMVSFGTIIAGFVVVFFCQKVGYERWQLVGFMVSLYDRKAQTYKLLTVVQVHTNCSYRVTSQYRTQRQDTGYRDHHYPGHEHHAAAIAFLCHDLHETSMIRSICKCSHYIIGLLGSLT